MNARFSMPPLIFCLVASAALWLWLWLPSAHGAHEGSARVTAPVVVEPRHGNALDSPRARPVWRCWIPSRPAPCYRWIADLKLHSDDAGWAVGRDGLLLWWDGVFLLYQMSHKQF